MKKLTSGQLCRYIKKIDPDSIVERKNVRYFCRKENLDYTICQGKWLMDLECFINKLNPKNILNVNVVIILIKKYSKPR